VWFSPVVRRVFSLPCILTDAQEHAGARLNLQITPVRSEDDQTDRIDSPCVKDLHMCEAVGSAGIGSENPKSLGAVIVIDLPPTSHSFIGAHANQNTTIDGFSEHFLCILR
jgi:hypothetical protein